MPQSTGKEKEPQGMSVYAAVNNRDVRASSSPPRPSGCGRCPGRGDHSMIDVRTVQTDDRALERGGDSGIKSLVSLAEYICRPTSPLSVLHVTRARLQASVGRWLYVCARVSPCSPLQPKRIARAPTRFFRVCRHCGCCIRPPITTSSCARCGMLPRSVTSPYWALVPSGRTLRPVFAEVLPHSR